MSWRKISMKFDGTCIVCNEKIKVNYLVEQNKLLNLSLIDVQERYDKRLKELEDRLNYKKMSISFFKGYFHQ